ncbi:MAG: hypothetical protein N2115_07505, partial [bacterium]|nr:hypothetical protein [bacterium]
MKESRVRKRIFLDTSSVTEWDSHIVQCFSKPEKVPIYGLEPGSKGEWDAAGTTCFGSVIKEDGVFRMWYNGLRIPSDYCEQVDLPVICYAESDDGIHWKKPDLKITGQHRYPGNNILALPGAPCGIVKTLPGAQWKYLACTFLYNRPLEKNVQDIPENPDPVKGNYGTHLWVSNDGLRWKHLKRLFAYNDNACLITDFETARYLLYQKIMSTHGLSVRRTWIGLESKDGENWEGYEGIRKWRECFFCDDFDDIIARMNGFINSEVYCVCVYRVGEILVSIETIFDVGLPLYQKFAANANGLCHTRIGFSYDGFRWRYPPGRPLFLERGDTGESDAGWIMPSTTLVEHDGYLLFYYGGSKFDHGWCINPDFTLRKDILLSEHRGTIRIMMARIKKDRFGGLAAISKGRVDVDAGFR